MVLAETPCMVCINCGLLGALTSRTQARKRFFLLQPPRNLPTRPRLGCSVPSFSNLSPSAGRSFAPCQLTLLSSNPLTLARRQKIREAASCIVSTRFLCRDKELSGISSAWEIVWDYGCGRTNQPWIRPHSYPASQSDLPLCMIQTSSRSCHLAFHQVPLLLRLERMLRVCCCKGWQATTGALPCPLVSIALEVPHLSNYPRLSSPAAVLKFEMPKPQSTCGCRVPSSHTVLAKPRVWHYAFSWLHKLHMFFLSTCHKCNPKKKTENDVHLKPKSGALHLSLEKSISSPRDEQPLRRLWN